MLQECLSFFMTIDHHLLSLVTSYGIWTYAVLFLIIFCETGLIITPFLPGDSLLFVAGNIAAQPNQAIQINLLFLLLVLASWLGNQLNYQVGRFIGPRVFKSKQSKLFNPRHLQEAHEFYQQHGKMTIILARFIPIIRTFVPFVAGVAAMEVWLYTLINLLSAILWIGVMLFAGYFLGRIPFIQAHFIVLIYGIVAISLIPSVLVFVKTRLKRRTPPLVL
jgi:membrane-associated protein